MAEKDELVASWREQRGALIDNLETLTEEQARRIIVPSGWSPVDLAFHVGTGVRYYVDAIVRGIEVNFDLDDPLGSWAWETPKDLTLAAALTRYRELGRFADDFIMAASLDMVPARQPVWEFIRHWTKSLRTVVLHLIDETARHAGHLDIVCEFLHAEAQHT
jgi:Protein of unknown function (DUF664)